MSKMVEIWCRDNSDILNPKDHYVDTVPKIEASRRCMDLNNSIDWKRSNLWYFQKPVDNG